MDIHIAESDLTPDVADALIKLSQDWEAENSCHGYRRNTLDDIKGNRIFLAKEGERIIGYLFGHVEKTARKTTITDADVPIFEVEEIYVVPEYRCRGIGTELFEYLENNALDGAEYIMLSTATKNWRAILHFYIDELGMEFWNARLFKRVKQDT